MSTKTKTTALAVNGVLGGIELVNQRIADLKHIQESVYKTSGKVTGFPGNIQTETNVSELVKLYSSVRARKQSYDASADELGIQSLPVFRVDGGTLEDFAHDVKLRIAIIQNKETLDELNAIKKEFTELMDKEDRMALLAKKLEKFGGTVPAAE